MTNPQPPTPQAALAEIEAVKQQLPNGAWRQGASLARCVEDLRMDRDCLARRAEAAEAQATAYRAALTPFASGGEWGRVKAWIVNGAPDRDTGIAAAAAITRWQTAVDVALSAPPETGRAKEPPKPRRFESRFHLAAGKDGEIETVTELVPLLEVAATPTPKAASPAVETREETEDDDGLDGWTPKFTVWLVVEGDSWPMRVDAVFDSKDDAEKRAGVRGGAWHVMKYSHLKPPSSAPPVETPLVAALQALVQQWRAEYQASLAYDRKHGLRDVTVQLGGKAMCADDLDRLLSKYTGSVPMPTDQTP